MRKMITLPANPTLAGMASLQYDVVYSTAMGEALCGTLMEPWRTEDAALRPAIVFVQGSGWTRPGRGYEIPQLARYAQAGYAVFTIEHRSRLEGHPFTAFLQDTKCAIRFLRANAEKYLIDPERIAIFGTSSGGNTALLVAMTGDDPRYRTQEYAEYSDAVCCMVECFGPTDMNKLMEAWSAGPEAQKVSETLRGDAPFEQVAHDMSPLYLAREGAKYPPMLLIHGDADTMVPYAQGEAMYARLNEIGADARMIRVAGAPHEHSFWSDALHRHIRAFLDCHML